MIPSRLWFFLSGVTWCFLLLLVIKWGWISEMSYWIVFIPVMIAVCVPVINLVKLAVERMSRERLYRQVEYAESSSAIIEI